MTDPRLVSPQRVVPVTGGPEDACAHRYWCWKRITATVLAGLLLVALVVGVWRWIG